jgi:hypothetical protein
MPHAGPAIAPQEYKFALANAEATLDLPVASFLLIE